MKARLCALALLVLLVATVATVFFRQVGATRVFVPPAISIPKLLDPETRAETVRDFLLRSDSRGMGKIFAGESLDEFKEQTISVYPFPLNAKPLGYIVSCIRQKSEGEKPEARDDPFRAGRLYVGRERTLLPDPTKSGRCVFVLRADGSWDESLISESMTLGFLNAFFADFDADGRCDVAVASEMGGTYAGLECVTSGLEISRPGEVGSTSLRVEWNLRRRGGAPAEWWGWWFEDADGDGVFDLNLGPQRDGKAVARASFIWDKAAGAWRIEERQKGTAFRAKIGEGEWSRDFDKDLSDGSLPQLGEPFPEFGPFAPKPPPDDISSPWKLRSLAGLNHGALFDEMNLTHSVHGLEREKILAGRKLPSLWTTPPRELAIALIREHRDVEARDAAWIGFDTSDGETPPENGMVTFSDGPSGCFAPGGAFITDVLCDGERSHIGRNSSLFDWSKTPLPFRKSAFTFRQAALSESKARQILQTVWWLGRARMLPLVSEGTGRLGGSTSDGWATVRLQSGAASREWAGNRYDRWTLPFLLGGIDAAPKETDIVVNITSWMFEEWMTEVLGKAWEPLSTERVGAVIEEFLAGRASYEAACVAVSAVAESGDLAFRPALLKVLAALPQESAAELRLKEIANESEKWTAIHGNQWTDYSAVYLRENARKKESFSSEPGLPEIPSLTDTPSPAASVVTKSAPQWMSVSLQELWLFEPFDALANESTRIKQAQSEAERSLVQLRQATTWAIQILDIWNDLAGLEKAARGKENFALQRLCEIAPARGSEVVSELLRSAENYESAELQEALLVLNRLGKTDATESDIPELDSTTVKAGPAQWRVAESWARFLVPPKEPMRHPWPALDAKLLDVLKAGNATGESCLALARRAPGGAWDALAADTSSGLNPLAIMAFKNPAGYREKLRARLSGRIEMADYYTDSAAFAAWLADIRELAPALERIATSRASDAEGSEIPARRHFARWILSLWTEPDAATRAKLLLAFAMGDAFDSEELPEAAAQAKAQLIDAWEKADAPGREDVRAFLEWCGKSGRISAAKHAFAESLLPNGATN